MGNEDLILLELRSQGERLSSIEKAIQAIATQQIEIVHIQQSIAQLWVKYDALIADKGPINEIQKHQASCPREEVKTLNTRMWALVIGFLMLLINEVIRMVRG
jgi:hypothetical protein